MNNQEIAMNILSKAAGEEKVEDFLLHDELWDSLFRIQIMVEIENHLGTMFDDQVMNSIRSIDDIVRILSENS